MSIDTIEYIDIREREHQPQLLHNQPDNLQLLAAVMKGVLVRKNTPEEGARALQELGKDSYSSLRLRGGLANSEDAVPFDPVEDVTYHPTGIVGPWFEVSGQGTEGEVRVLLVAGTDLSISGQKRS
jgi:hypothetical protein